MTSRDFCYWLQGYFEISSMQGEIKISDAQARIIQAHLNLVFKHEIDPENFKDKSEKEISAYEEIHKGAKSATEFDIKDYEKTKKEIDDSIFKGKKYPFSEDIIATFPQDGLRKDFETDSQVKFNC